MQVLDLYKVTNDEMQFVLRNRFGERLYRGNLLDMPYNYLHYEVLFLDVSIVTKTIVLTVYNWN